MCVCIYIYIYVCVRVCVCVCVCVCTSVSLKWTRSLKHGMYVRVASTIKKMYVTCGDTRQEVQICGRFSPLYPFLSAQILLRLLMPFVSHFKTQGPLTKEINGRVL